MGNSWINEVSEEEVETILNQNADMLNSAKGKLTNNVSNLKNLLILPLTPLLVVIVSCLEFETWYGKLLGSIFLNLIIIPIAAVAAVLEVVIGVACIPLALLFEGIPALFSKQYRKEYKLSRAVKKLSNLLKRSQNTFYEQSERFSLSNPDVRRLISEIKILNEQLGRNIPTSQNAINVERLEEYTNLQQSTKEQSPEQNKKYSTLKGFDKSDDKHQDSEQEF